MPDRKQIAAALDQLNSLLVGVTPYKLAVVAPGELKPAPKNAHYMPQPVFERLLGNVKRDGNLSSFPFCWRKDDGSFVILSGHHRVDAALQAGVSLILIVYTDKELSRSEQVAIQLSHNAINGLDNPVLLTELWKEITDLNEKVYSGLDDQFIEKLAPPQFVKIQDADLQFRDLVFAFVQPEIDRVADVLKVLENKAKRSPVFVGRYEDFDAFFDALLKFKEVAGVYNTSTALLMLVEIAEKWVAEQKEAEQEAALLEVENG